MPKVIQIPPKSELEQMRVVEKRTTASIGEEYGVSPPTVGKWLLQYGIKKRPSNCPPKEDLKRLRLVEKKTMASIGEEYGVSSTTIGNWLAEQHIAVRCVNRRPPKGELENILSNEHNTFTAIGKHYGVTYRTILNWIKYYDIDTAQRHCVQSVKWHRPPKRELEHLRFVEKKSNAEIANWYGVPSATVSNWISVYNIQRLYKPRRSRACSILKKHARDLKDDPERLSTEFMQRMIGVKYE